MPVPGSPPIDPPSPPSFRMPADACDAHFHMLAGPGDFPLWENRADLAEAFLTWGGYAYGAGAEGGDAQGGARVETEWSAW